MQRSNRWTLSGSKTISEGLAGHRNSLGLIRLVLASAVIFSHAFYLGGWGHDPFLDLVHEQDSIGGIAVLGFFAISGYLIAKSGMTSDALQFIWRRGLRILPAYWMVLLAAALVVGPFVWHFMGRPLSDYFTLAASGPFSYVTRNFDLSIRQWGIYDIFVSNPYGAATFNGSLWTLKYEWGSYLIIWVLLIVGVLSRARFFVPIVTGVYFLAELAIQFDPSLLAPFGPLFGDPYRISLPLIFLYGACAAVYSKRIRLDWKLAVVAALAVVLSLAFGGFVLFGYPGIAYLVLWLAAALPKSVQWIGQKNDYSYGIYLYGFLVQQFTAWLGWYQWGYLPWSLAALGLSWLCAWLSWHLIEKWAMRLKDVGPGRGIRYWWDRVRGLFTRGRARQMDAAPTVDEAEVGASHKPENRTVDTADSDPNRG